jgi:nitrate reductase NapD
MVVALEADRSGVIADQIDAIHSMPGVYSASLVYQHHEDVAALDEEIRDEPHASKLY